MILQMRLGEDSHAMQLAGIILTVLLIGFGNVDKPTEQSLTVGYNVPSIGTAVMFGLICLPAFKKGASRHCGLAVMTMATTAAVGHITGIKWLHFYFDEISTAMARPTLTAGAVLGWLMIRESSKRIKYI